MLQGRALLVYDVNLIPSNCEKYNGENAIISQNAHLVARTFHKLLHDNERETPKTSVGGYAGVGGAMSLSSSMTAAVPEPMEVALGASVGDSFGVDPGSGMGAGLVMDSVLGGSTGASSGASTGANLHTHSSETVVGADRELHGGPSVYGMDGGSSGAYVGDYGGGIFVGGAGASTGVEGFDGIGTAFGSSSGATVGMEPGCAGTVGNFHGAATGGVGGSAGWIDHPPPGGVGLGHAQNWHNQVYGHGQGLPIPAMSQLASNPFCAACRNRFHDIHEVNAAITCGRCRALHHAACIVDGGGGQQCAHCHATTQPLYF